jgi:hypothetical protein
MVAEYPYPHLALPLRRLAGDALALWGNARERRRALEAIIAAWDAADVPARDAAVLRVDIAILAGLEALGLPRDPGSRVAVGSFGRSWIGRAAVDGTILLDVDWLRYGVIAISEPDRIFHTWVHESLHARRPSSAGRGPESAAWMGYEEGAVEGLARLVTGVQAGMDVKDPGYEHYVAAYRSLAQAGGFEPERLWRVLWAHHPGEVRRHFGAAVGAARQERHALPLNPDQQSRLMAVADRVFASGRLNDRPNIAVLTRIWEVVFQ